MKTIKNLDAKAIKNIQAVKGGAPETTTLGEISALASLEPAKAPEPSLYDRCLSWFN